MVEQKQDIAQDDYVSKTAMDALSWIQNIYFKNDNLAWNHFKLEFHFTVEKRDLVSTISHSYLIFGQQKGYSIPPL